MSLDGSKMDFLKRAHDVEPSQDEHDPEHLRMPWKWMTRFLQALDAGQLRFRDAEEDAKVYKSFMDTSLVVEAKGDGSPRPCAMVHPARKLGGAFNFTGEVRKACGGLMRQWRNLGFGTEAANDVMPLHFQLRFERDGKDMVILELDVAGAYPNVWRSAVQKAIRGLTGCLEFLKYRFFAFHHMVANVMYRDLSGVEHWHEFGEGLQQGAGSSGFEYSAAHQMAMEEVRKEFEQELQDLSYVDDVRAALEATARVSVEEHPRDVPFLAGATSMPLAVAIAKSMKRNFKEKCGLDINFTDAPSGKGHKNRIIRFDDREGLNVDEYGDVDGEHIKIVYGGTLVQGSPVGVDACRVEQLCKVVSAKIGATGNALNGAPGLQVRSFLGQQCAGAQPVQHVMRSQARRIWEMKPMGGGQSAIEMAEDLSIAEMKSLVGGSYLSQRVLFQMALAVRMGGSGQRPIREFLDAALLGGWTAAHSSSISVGYLDGQWKNVNWSIGGWQTCADVQLAWKRVIGSSKHLRYLAAAIQAMGVAAIGMNEGDGSGEVELGSFGKFHGAYDKAWKANKLGAKELEEVGTSAWERMDLDLQSAARGSGAWTPMVLDPGSYLEVLKKWVDLGDCKFQKTFSAAAKRQRFLEYEQITQRHNTRREEAHLRSVLGDWSHVPLVTIPKLDVGKWQDEDFIFYVHERFLMRQPALLPVRNKKCVCGKGKVSEEHLDGCRINAGWIRAHNDLRDLIALMCEMAGIETEVETPNLMQDQTKRRPGDVVLVNVNMPGLSSKHTKFAVDVGLVSADDGVSACRLHGAEVTGAAARRKQLQKWVREGRGKALCLLGYEFVPLIVERGGAISESVKKFIKNVSDVSYSRKKHDKEFFVHYWTGILANAVFQDVARMRRRQVRGLVDVTSKNVLQNTRLMIQDGQMSSVSAEGRMFA